MRDHCINRDAAPRMAESEDDFWTNLKVECHKNGFLILETPKKRYNFLFDHAKNQYDYERCERIPDKNAYWGYNPVVIEPTEAELDSLHSAVSKDIVSVYAKVGGVEIRIHRPLGLWKKDKKSA